MASLRKGDTVYIYKLDRLGRSLKHLLDMVAELEFRGVGLVSLTDAINTTSAQGRLVFNLFASLAEFERELIRERTHAGLASARARGRVGGRQRDLSEVAERTAIIAETLYREQQLGVNEIAKRLDISKVTLYKYLRHRGVVIHSPQSCCGQADRVSFVPSARLNSLTCYFFRFLRAPNSTVGAGGGAVF